MAEVPDIGYMRDLWVSDQLDPLPREVGVPLVPEYERAFDAMVAQVKAEAWDEGFRKGQDSETSDPAFWRGSTYANPYRAAETEATR